MKSKAIARGWTALLCSVILVGAGAVLVTPMANAVAGINWASVWKHQLQPRADQRYFTKAQATRRFAPMPKVIRGTFMSQVTAAGPGDVLTADISFGWNLGRAPVVHVIAFAATPPTGCSGTVARPNASPGNLCVFQNATLGATDPIICRVKSVCGKATPFGAFVIATTTDAGIDEISGTWAVSPLTTVRPSKAPALGIAPTRPTGH
jgi:hypothetical protein